MKNGKMKRRIAALVLILLLTKFTGSRRRRYGRRGGYAPKAYRGRRR